MRLVICGAGGLARETLVDDAWAEGGATALHGIPIRTFTWLRAEPETTCAVVAVGDPRLRARMAYALGRRTVLTLRHPRAVVSARAVVEPGAVLQANAVVSDGALVERHAFVNVGAFVAHSTRVGAGAVVGPHATVCGECTLGAGVAVGAGASILPGRRVGAWATVGAGAVVMRDVADGVTVAGNPARPIARRDPAAPRAA
jgi:sugar O-acyltransferase (sialic acid O-acetyltransferase NeuD family)